MLELGKQLPQAKGERDRATFLKPQVSHHQRPSVAKNF
jgi:hypothetical protein